MSRNAENRPVVSVRAVAGFLRKTRRASALVALASLCGPLAAMNCTPDSITLSSQSEVDAFQVDHGPCDTLVGVLEISGGDIVDLSPLSGITTADFGSTILIQNNPVLASLDGLSGLTSARWLEINNNPVLTSIGGLSSLGFLSGPLFIQGNSSLSDVAGLEGVSHLSMGALILRDNQNLSDLSGLSNLTEIAAALVVDNNDALTSLAGLSGLSAVGSNITIIRNDSLASIDGLSGIADFSAGVNIIDNSVLSDLDGFPAVVDLFGLKITNNPALIHLDGLYGLTAIGGGLLIDNNAVLENLDGLAELVSLESDLEITDNPQLSQCSGLATLLDEVDDAQPGPGPGDAGIPDINGEVLLSGNLAGCNSVTQILDSRPPRPDGVTFVAGPVEFLFKGFAITRGCVVPMLALPGPEAAQGRDLLLQCAGTDYADTDTLVYRALDKSCSASALEGVASIAYETPVHAPFTPYSGSLAEVSDALFDEAEAALLALNLRTSELTRVGTFICNSTESSEVVFADGFE